MSAHRWRWFRSWSRCDVTAWARSPSMRRSAASSLRCSTTHDASAASRSWRCWMRFRAASAPSWRRLRQCVPCRSGEARHACRSPKHLSCSRRQCRRRRLEALRWRLVVNKVLRRGACRRRLCSQQFRRRSSLRLRGRFKRRQLPSHLRQRKLLLHHRLRSVACPCLLHRRASRPRRHRVQRFRHYLHRRRSRRHLLLWARQHGLWLLMRRCRRSSAARRRRCHRRSWRGHRRRRLSCPSSLATRDHPRRSRHRRQGRQCSQRCRPRGLRQSLHRQCKGQRCS